MQLRELKNDGAEPGGNSLWELDEHILLRSERS
jgi:hypothetical protein